MTHDSHQKLLLELAIGGDSAAFCSLFHAQITLLFAEMTGNGIQPQDVINTAVPMYREAYKRLVLSSLDAVSSKGTPEEWHSRHVLDGIRRNSPESGITSAGDTVRLPDAAAASHFIRAVKKGLMQEQALLRKKKAGKPGLGRIFSARVPIGGLVAVSLVILIIAGVGVYLLRAHCVYTGMSASLVLEKDGKQRILPFFGRSPVHGGFTPSMSATTPDTVVMQADSAGAGQPTAVKVDTVRSLPVRPLSAAAKPTVPRTVVKPIAVKPASRAVIDSGALSAQTALPANNLPASPGEIQPKDTNLTN